MSHYIEITDEIVEEVGDEIGMHHGGWDTENPKDIIRASVWVVMKRLSPTTRELLLSNPEAVEKCVEAVKVYREFGYKEARDLLNDASELLPKEEPPK